MGRIEARALPSGGFGVINPANPVWVKYTIGFAALQAAGTTNAVAIFTLPIKGYIQRVVMNLTTPFVGTTTLTGSIGIAGTVTKYVAVSNLMASANTTYVDGITTPLFESISATTAININAISTVQNLSALSAGSVDIWFLISTLP
jgi:hypothetical protein